ncbi:hypothetical protein [Halobacillus salinus]|uniref:hypothetical protein n=1 Tax=Halobacillus salinus TaxID=192814 RepID=UPI00130522AC|nr:hypothetical protein [Halobacillus salinus]
MKSDLRSLIAAKIVTTMSKPFLRSRQKSSLRKQPTYCGLNALLAVKTTRASRQANEVS